MSNEKSDQWEGVSDDAPAKKKTSGWVWGCGIGCLILLILGIVMTAMGVKMVTEGVDPEKQWPAIQKALPFDERPVDTHTLMMGFKIPLATVENYMLSFSGTDLVGQIQVYDAGAEVDLLMDPESSANNNIAMDVGEAVFGKMAVQGRLTSFLAFDRTAARQESYVRRVKLATAGHRQVILDLTRDGTMEVTEQDVVDFLAPFDVWRNDNGDNVELVDSDEFEQGIDEGAEAVGAGTDAK